MLARARQLHPDETFADDAPSRFRKEGAAPAPAAGGAEAKTNGAAVDAGPRPSPHPAAAAPKPNAGGAQARGGRSSQRPRRLGGW